MCDTKTKEFLCYCDRALVRLHATMTMTTTTTTTNRMEIIRLRSYLILIAHDRVSSQANHHQSHSLQLNVARQKKRETLRAKCECKACEHAHALTYLYIPYDMHEKVNASWALSMRFITVIEIDLDKFFFIATCYYIHKYLCAFLLLL